MLNTGKVNTLICCLCINGECLDATNVGDEGGFAPNIGGAKEGLELLKEAIAKGEAFTVCSLID
jgi:enolase